MATMLMCHRSQGTLTVILHIYLKSRYLVRIERHLERNAVAVTRLNICVEMWYLLYQVLRPLLENLTASRLFAICCGILGYKYLSMYRQTVITVKGIVFGNDQSQEESRGISNETR